MRYLATLVGVGKSNLEDLAQVATTLSRYDGAAVISFNKRHAAIEPLDIIHGELAFRLYPYLKDSYLCIVRLIEETEKYVKIPIGNAVLPRTDRLRSMGDLAHVVTKVVIPHISKIRKMDRREGDHNAMISRIQETILSLKSLIQICEGAFKL